MWKNNKNKLPDDHFIHSGYQEIDTVSKLLTNIRRRCYGKRNKWPIEGVTQQHQFNYHIMEGFVIRFVLNDDIQDRDETANNKWTSS